MNPEILDTLKFEKFIYKGLDYYLEHHKEEPPELKPGNVLLMKDGNYILVGHVNKHLGVCDDCTDYNMKDIVEIATLYGF